VTTITIAEVIGPLRAGDEPVARRYRATLEAWQVAQLNAEIAESAARLRDSLKLPDAIQAASALAINAVAIVTHDRDFSRVHSLRVMR
jgi:predicted nucleic acid-binding protein